MKHFCLQANRRSTGGILVVLFWLCCMPSSWAQTTGVAVTGVVSGEDGGPLPGVTVAVKGTTTGTVTDASGTYKLTVPNKGSVLVFSFIGYLSEEITVGEQTKVDIQLVQDLTTLQEVVVVGYGTQKKANLTGAVATVDFQDVQNIPQASTVNMLSGRLPGVSVVQGSGQPGKDAGEIFVRGVGTLNDAAPLVIIDGVQATLTDLSNLPPQEIDNVTVLKDASSAAIYGARGGNGVILVTTKLPKTEKMSINFNAYTAWQQATTLPRMVNSWQFMELVNESLDNTLFPLAVIDSAKAGLYSDNIGNTNWFDEIFRTAPLTNYNLSFSGRTKGTSFQIGGGYQDQQGILIGTSAKRYNVRTNIKTDINKAITLGLNIWGYRNESSEPWASANAIITQANRLPSMPVRYANGDFAVFHRYVNANAQPNPVLNSQIGFGRERETKINAQPSVQVHIAKGLRFNGSVTYSYTNFLSTRFNPTYSYNSNQGQPISVNPNSRLIELTRNMQQLQFQNVLHYDTKIGEKHQFGALVGHEALDSKTLVFQAQADRLPLNDLPVLGSATSQFSVDGSVPAYWRLQSFFGRVNYAFMDKYLVEANIRTDGSSRVNGRYRVTPSASLGWVASQESFMESLSNTISFLKLRAGYGISGNDRLGGDFFFRQALNLGTLYPVGTQLETGASITSYANPDITWEKSTTYNVGLDLGLLKNKIYVNIDAYTRITDDILYQIPVPLSFGAAAPAWQNVAQVTNRGLEVAVQYQGKKGKFSYNVNLNAAYNDNEVTGLKGQRVISGNNILQEGAPINAWFGYTADGLYTQQDLENNYPRFNDNPAIVVGSIKFKDINGDGKVNDGDRKVIGNGATPYTFGGNISLKYGFVDMSVLLQGVADKDIYVYDIGNRPGNEGTSSFWAEWYERRYDPVNNPNGDWPIIKRQSPEAAATSTFWLRKANYVRVKNLEIGYTLPKSLLKRIQVDNARIYAAANNLVTLSSVTRNLDPERSNFRPGNDNYPQTRVYSVGINLGF